MCKGPFAFAPLGVILFFYVLSIRAKGMARVISAFLIGCAVPIGLWFLFAGGRFYLERFFIEHVSSRLGHYTFSEHLEPLRNLVHVYWPWLPFAAIGFVRSARGFFQVDHRDRSAAALTAFAFIFGFAVVASFLEQYHAATYPCLAIVSALGIPTNWGRYRSVVEKGALVIAVGFAVFMAFFPHALRGTEYKNPFRVALRSARAECRDPRIRRVVISTGIADIWYALSIGAWNTDWEPRSDHPERSPEETDAQILLAAKSEPVGAGWVPSEIEADGLRIYRSSTITECKPK